MIDSRCVYRNKPTILQTVLSTTGLGRKAYTLSEEDQFERSEYNLYPDYIFYEGTLMNESSSSDRLSICRPSFLTVTLNIYGGAAAEKTHG